MAPGKYIYLGLALGAALATPARSGDIAVGLRSSIHAGWTSNASDAAFGAADAFLRTSQGLDVGGEGEGSSLRGSLSFEQVRYSHFSYEDDTALSFDLAAGRRVADGLVLRGSFFLAAADTGDEIVVAGLVVPTRATSTTLTGGLEALLDTGLGQWRFGASAGVERPGSTVLAGTGLDPVRLSPDIGSLAFTVALDRPLAPDATGTLGMLLRLTGVSPEDEAAFDRLAINALRGRLGAEVSVGPVTAGGEGGIEVLWAAGSPNLRIVPVGAASLGWTIGEALRLILRASGDTELADPIDGAVSYIAQASAGVGWDIGNGTRLTLDASVAHEVGLADGSLWSTTRALGAGIAHAVGERLAIALEASSQMHDRFDGAWTRSQLTVSLSGQI